MMRRFISQSLISLDDLGEDATGFDDAFGSALGSCNFELSCLRSDKFYLLLGFASSSTLTAFGKKVNICSLASAVRARYFYS